MKIKLTRENNEITLNVGDENVLIKANEQFCDVPLVSLFAGPTGLELKHIQIKGITEEGTPFVLEDDFSPLADGKHFTELWLGQLLKGALIASGALFILLISGGHLPFLNLRLWGILFLSWFLWSFDHTGENALTALIGALQFILFLPALAMVMNATSSEDLEKGPERTSSFVFSIVVITLFAVCSCFIVSWQNGIDEISSPIVNDSKKKNTFERTIEIGKKILKSREGTDFDWYSEIEIGKNSITEWVFRKYTGSDSTKVAWYSLTLSRDPAHQSGIYITRNTWQELLQPIQLNALIPTEKNPDKTKVKVRIKARGPFFTVTINDQPPVTLKNDELGLGEVSLVPINYKIKVLMSYYKPLKVDRSFIEQLILLAPALLIWIFIPLLLLFWWSRKSKPLNPIQMLGGLTLIYTPYFSTVANHLSAGENVFSNLAVASLAAFFILFLLVLLVDKKKSFFGFSELIILLIFLELHFSSIATDPRLQANPIQAEYSTGIVLVSKCKLETLEFIYTKSDVSQWCFSRRISRSKKKADGSIPLSRQLIHGEWISKISSQCF